MIMYFGQGIEVFMAELYEICREKKDNAVPRMTNQDLADATGKSTNTVAQFLRGDAPNATYETVAAICKELNVSMDEVNGIKPTAPNPDRDLLTKIQTLNAENEALRQGMDRLNEHLATCKKSLKMHRTVTIILLGMLFMVLLALIYDVLNPNVGWIRRMFASLQQALRIPI